MDWKTILASTVLAAVITAAINIVKTIMDNKAKQDDSIRLFRYTKLYEIVVDWQKCNSEAKVDSTYEIARNHNLVQHFQLARPLVDQMHWGDIEAWLKKCKEIKIKTINAFQKDEPNQWISTFIECNGRAEECFSAAIEKQMKILLKSK